jgi:hypothetical protein
MTGKKMEINHRESTRVRIAYQAAVAAASRRAAPVRPYAHPDKPAAGCSAAPRLLTGAAMIDFAGAGSQTRPVPYPRSLGCVCDALSSEIAELAGAIAEYTEFGVARFDVATATSLVAHVRVVMRAIEGQRAEPAAIGTCNVR